MIELGLEWAGTLLAIVGAILNAKVIRGGFSVWIVANACLIAFAALTENWGIFTLFVVYTGISIFGLQDWKRKGIGG